MLRLTYVSCAAYIKRLLEEAATAELRVVALAFCPVPTHTAPALSAFFDPKKLTHNASHSHLLY